MKMAVSSWTAAADKATISAKSSETTVTAGAESILLLPADPGMDVLTLQMERERSNSVLSSGWKITTNTAKKKMASDAKMILPIRL
jgi:hypothetical protein